MGIIALGAFLSFQSFNLILTHFSGSRSTTHPVCCCLCCLVEHAYVSVASFNYPSTRTSQHARKTNVECLSVCLSLRLSVWLSSIGIQISVQSTWRPVNSHVTRVWHVRRVSSIQMKGWTTIAIGIGGCRRVAACKQMGANYARTG